MDKPISKSSLKSLALSATPGLLLPTDKNFVIYGKEWLKIDEICLNSGKFGDKL